MQMLNQRDNGLRTHGTLARDAAEAFRAETTDIR
jgi:hypothetical protein